MKERDVVYYIYAYPTPPRSKYEDINTHAREHEGDSFGLQL